MARNNVKLLTDNQLAHFNKRYHFTIDGNDIVVKIDDYERVTRHPIDKAFSINAKKIRKICFSKQAIDLWIELQKMKKTWTLVDVQQAVNKLYIMYQPINVDSVRDALSKPTQKIRKV